MKIIVFAFVLFLIFAGYFLSTQQMEINRQELKEIRDWKEYKNFCDHMKRARRI